MRLNRSTLTLAAAAAAAIMLGPLAPHAFADETCNSPYMSNLIKGQEDFLTCGRWA